MIPSLTILLLDDEPMLRRATAMLLADRGGRVTAAASPDEAVALSGARSYDVGVFDLSLPGPSASEVLRRMKARGAAPRRVIAVCDAPLGHDDASAFAAVLCKPYAFERLVRAIFGQGRRAPRTGPRRVQARSGPRRGAVARLHARTARSRWAARRVRRPRRAARAWGGRG
jgi:DNA-binding response OmpR family regulator